MTPGLVAGDRVVPMSKPHSTAVRSCEFVGSFFDSSKLPRDRRAQVAFAGRSNVGKSTLLNTLVGHKKAAKVSSTPGKTRSLNFFLINNRYYFVDLPGYGYARVSREMRRSWQRLIEEYLDTSDRLAGLVLLMDCRREITDEDQQLAQWLADRSLPVLAVVTKADKLNRDKINRKVREVESALGADAIAFSAVSGLGKHELLRSIQNLVVESSNQEKV